MTRQPCQTLFQNLAIKTIQDQAKTLGLNLIETELPSNCPNKIYLERVGDNPNSQDKPIDHLLFGDWILEDIRQWREAQLGKLGYSCMFPIWRKNLPHLLHVLESASVQIQISHDSPNFQSWVQVGYIYDQQFVDHLPKQINPMGDKGELHIEVKFQQ